MLCALCFAIARSKLKTAIRWELLWFFVDSLSTSMLLLLFILVLPIFAIWIVFYASCCMLLFELKKNSALNHFFIFFVYFLFFLKHNVQLYFHNLYIYEVSFSSSLQQSLYLVILHLCRNTLPAKNLMPKCEMRRQEGIDSMDFYGVVVCYFFCLVRNK